MSNHQKRSLIDEHFDAYLDRNAKPGEAQKAAEPYLDEIDRDFEEKLEAYIQEIQKNAYRAGFSDAMMLAAECYKLHRKK